LGKYERCRTCVSGGVARGFELGAVTINTILTFIVLTAGMTVGFIMTSPDIPVLPMVLALLGVAILMPIDLPVHVHDLTRVRSGRTSP
jgi:hypothetical protein